MARSARVLLSILASSAVLERDFSAAGKLIAGSRSRLDATFTQMVLFLNGTLGGIPAEVAVMVVEGGKGQGDETAVKSSASRRATLGRTGGAIGARI